MIFLKASSLMRSCLKAINIIQAVKHSTLDAGSATIFALSSGKGRSGVAVIRMSGPEASSVLQKMINQTSPPPRLASIRTIWDPERQEKLDRGLVVFFRGKKISFCPGNPGVI